MIFSAAKCGKFIFQNGFLPTLNCFGLSFGKMLPLLIEAEREMLVKESECSRKKLKKEVLLVAKK
ncbi:MAG: hypothetical protein J6C75_05115, partial [Oscillospiraceae bacterium]|nr:hypothetical protein [Oscillospiraceae bacterium]